MYLWGRIGFSLFQDVENYHLIYILTLKNLKIMQCVIYKYLLIIYSLFWMFFEILNVITILSKYKIVNILSDDKHINLKI